MRQLGDERGFDEGHWHSHTKGLRWGLQELLETVEQVHCSRRRLLRRGLEFHVCTINKSVHMKKVRKLIVCTSLQEIVGLIILANSFSDTSMLICNIDICWVPKNPVAILLGISKSLIHTEKWFFYLVLLNHPWVRNRQMIQRYLYGLWKPFAPGCTCFLVLKGQVRIYCLAPEAPLKKDCWGDQAFFS